MPKLKTNSGAAKRFMRRGNGSIKKRSAFRNHILTKKSQKLKRQSRGLDSVNQADLNGVLRMLGDK